MDSRIREIEQWIEQAKTGLSDGGREEYVKKLFLLDAEIRAVIKENGNIPGVDYSPERRGGGARRSASRLVAAGAAASVLLLAAAAAWFANPVAHTQDSPAPVQAVLEPATAGKGAAPSQHIPGMISGEEVVVANWLDSETVELLMASSAGQLAPADQAPVLDIGPALADRPAQPGMPGIGGDGQAVMLAVSNGGPEGAAQLQPAAYSATAQAARGATRIVPASAERFVSVDIVDNNNPQDPDDVDKLDPDALKRNVEKHFAE